MTTTSPTMLPAYILMDNLTAQDDLHAGIDAFAQGDEYNETILRRLRKDCGVEAGTAPDRVLSFLAQVSDGMPADMIAPIMFEDDPPSADDLDKSVSFLLAMRCIEEHSGVITVEPVLLRAIEALR